MWKVKWYNYYWQIETIIITDIAYQNCISYDANYYITAEKIKS